MNANLNKYFVSACCAVLLGFSAHGQLTVTPNGNANDLANAILGSGVTVSNVVLDCGPNAAGTFSNGNASNIGLDNGVLLTTGLASNAIGPNTSDETSFNHTTAFHGDPDLATYSNWPLNDACVLSFDFVSSADVITVQYVFGSEEYNEYVCSVYNDIFAFFVTGPNPNGGSYSNENVALVPGTSLPVAINTVNNGSPGAFGSFGNCTSLDYSAFYIDNVGGSTIEYDGFTTPLVASIEIVPNQTYSFKFAIADVSDGILDSGVFIKGESFSVFACQAGSLNFADGSPSPLVLCSDDGTQETVDVNTNSSIAGSNYTFILTEEDGSILAFDEDGIFVPESYGAGPFLVYGLSYDGVVSIPPVGGNISDVSAENDNGCFELSSPIGIVIEVCNPCSLEVSCPMSDGGTFACVDELPEPNPGAIEILDACGDVSIDVTILSSGTGCVYDPMNVQYTYEVSDGNTSTSCVVNYTVIDDVAPVFTTSLEPITIDCSEDPGTISVEAVDNCSDVSITFTETIIDTELLDCEGFRTQTPGGWGSSASGNNAGAYRDANFAGAFPNGLSIGCVNTLTLSSAGAVEAFLPAGGQPSALPSGDLIDPINYGNGFASHLVAATLSLGFDAYDPNFASSNGFAGDLIFNNGQFTGFTVSEVVAIANEVIGGCSDAYSPSQLTAALTLFNENYVDGSIDNGNFSCAGDSDPCVYTICRSWAAEDACGNIAVQCQEITVEDTTDPVVTSDLPQEITVECSDEVPAFEPTFADNCDDELEITAISSIAVDGCTQIISRSVTAIDDCGNSVSASQTVYIVDTTAPVLFGTPQDLTISCEDELPEVAQVTAEDACDEIPSIEFSESIDDSACPVRITRTWTASDDCGNTSTHVQVITIIDEDAPVFAEFPYVVQVSCESIDDYTVEVSDNCSEVNLTYSDQLQSGGCYGYLVRTWIAMDACGNTSTAEQMIQITDFIAPEILGVGDNMSVSCDDVPMIPEVIAVDNCGEASLSFEESIIPGDCPANYTIVWTWTAIDYCENTSVAVQTIEVSDNEGPEFIALGEDLVLECGSEIPAPYSEVVDNCSDFSVEVSEDIIEGDCPQAYTIVRTYLAIDDCGNTSIAVQTIEIVDQSAPEFTFVSADATIECDEAHPAGQAEAIDNCGEVSISMVESILESDCESVYTLIRTWTAIDACGNSSQAQQVIEVVDTTAPEILNLPEPTLILDCEAEVPAPSDLSATDNCDSNIELAYTEEIIGDLPAEGSSADCLAITPEAYANGLTCSQLQPWSLVLFGFADQGTAYYETIEANWVEYPDGSALLTGSVVDLNNANAGWTFEVAFENGMDWESWSNHAFPTSYKDDCSISGDNHFDWMYYIMSAGAELIGWGDYEGESLEIAHAPSNLYYGYQVGVAANNVNNNYGGGGWFTYTGVFQGESVSGGGDFAFDHDCCPRYTIERTWTATDCAGNSTSFVQTISFEALGLQPGGNLLGCTGDLDGDGQVAMSDFLMLLGGFGCEGNCAADVDGDGVVNAADLMLLLPNLGTSCN